MDRFMNFHIQVLTSSTPPGFSGLHPGRTPFTPANTHTYTHGLGKEELHSPFFRTPGLVPPGLASSPTR